jgi:superfamily I DNA/RNA helicase
VYDQVIAQTVPDHWTFDTLIVDEGQDFEPIWPEILGLFLRQPHDVLWLEDPDQNVRDLQPAVLTGFVGYRARVNYRSPRSIARFIRRVASFEFEAMTSSRMAAMEAKGTG